MPLSSWRALKAWKSEHCRPATSMIWMYSPAFTRNPWAVQRSMRISARGSASGSGNGGATMLGTAARLTMTDQIGRRILRIGAHRAAGRVEDGNAIAFGRQLHRLARPRVAFEQMCGLVDAGGQAAPAQRCRDRPRILALAGEQAARYRRTSFLP